MYFCDLFKDIKSAKYKTVGDSVDYCIQVLDDRIRLLFECSNGQRDWVNNFDFPIKPYKHQENTLLYHRGFARAYNSAKDIIMAELIPLMSQHKDKVVEVSGWSHGGALAVIAAEDIYYRTGEEVSLITYGAPKVCYGQKTRKRLIESCFFAVQLANNNDIVPLQPPFLFYCHVNKIKIGAEDFSLKKLFNPKKYHCIYDDIETYHYLTD